MGVLIYVLALMGDKYYVGVTSRDMWTRFNEHVNGKGAAWTRKYKPVRVVENFSGDEYDEDKTVLKYMNRFGIDNVRGGSFSKIELTKDDLSSIRNLLSTAKGTCKLCDQKGHYMSECPLSILPFRDESIPSKDEYLSYSKYFDDRFGNRPPSRLDLNISHLRAFFFKKAPNLKCMLKYVEQVAAPYGYSCSLGEVYIELILKE